jgi:UDP-GlcNAc:undecaprenyl-phosphate GlcNAc-1-phosphate transferase
MAVAWLAGAAWLSQQGGEKLEYGFAWAFIPAALVLIVVGLADDVRGLTGIYKLMGQVLSASLMVAGGFRFDIISLLGVEWPLGDFSVAFSLFFCLGAINAFNLIDGSDALASSIGAVVCLTLGVITACQGGMTAALASFALAGALLGFLKFNAPPARIYLGDTGSMLIGLSVAAIAIGSSIKHHTAVALAVPVAICAVPILDAAAAIVRRMTTGQSVFTADRGHLHHALLLRGLSVGETAAAAAGLTAITCAGALASYFTGVDAIALLAVVIVFSALAAARVFGHAELRLLASHVKQLGRRIRQGLTASGSEEESDQSIQLQGACPWNELWDVLRETASRHGLHSMKLNLGIPHLHESFYGSWQTHEPASDGWHLTLPLTWRGSAVGRLALVGSAHGAAGLEQLQQFLDNLTPIETEIGLILSASNAPARTLADKSRDEPFPQVRRRDLERAVVVP